MGYGSVNRFSCGGNPPGPSLSRVPLDLLEGAEEHFPKLTPVIGSLSGLSAEASRLKGLRAWVLQFPDSWIGYLPRGLHPPDFTLTTKPSWESDLKALTPTPIHALPCLLTLYPALRTSL